MGFPGISLHVGLFGLNDLPLLNIWEVFSFQYFSLFGYRVLQEHNRSPCKGRAAEPSFEDPLVYVVLGVPAILCFAWVDLPVALTPLNPEL